MNDLLMPSDLKPADAESASDPKAKLPPPPEPASVKLIVRLFLIPLLIAGAAVIALIKPQFEVGKGKVGKGGVVRSHEEHMRVIDKISQAAVGFGYHVCGTIESPLLGPKGNKEFFLHLKDTQGLP